MRMFFFKQKETAAGEELDRNLKRVQGERERAERELNDELEALKQETPKGTSAVMAGWLDDHSVGLKQCLL